MSWRARGVVLLSALALLGACGGGAPAPAAPAPAVADGAPSAEATPLTDLPLATGGTCEDRARARPLCLAAAEGQCRSQRSDCEAGCQPRLGPGSSEKEPALRGDIEEEHCREGCRTGETACRQSIVARCPTACGTPAAH